MSGEKQPPNIEGDKNPLKDQESKLYDLYTELWKTAWDAELAKSNLYDASLLTLSSSLIGFSVAFLKFLVTEPDNINMLFASWVFLSISIVSVLLSTVFNQHSSRKHRDLLWKWYHGQIDRLRKGIREPQQMGSNFWDILIKIADPAAGVTFAIGLLLFCVFAFNNGSNQGETMANEEHQMVSEIVQIREELDEHIKAHSSVSEITLGGGIPPTPPPDPGPVRFPPSPNPPSPPVPPSPPPK